MVMFKAVDPADILTNREGRRGRVSYPLLKSFMEAGIKMAELDMAGLGKNPQYFRSVLTSYIRNHKLPVRLFSARGVMYLMRLDMDNEGVVNPNWKWDDEGATEGAGGSLRDLPAQPITPQVVQERAGIERNNPTK